MGLRLPPRLRISALGLSSSSADGRRLDRPRLTARELELFLLVLLLFLDFLVGESGEAAASPAT